MQGHDGLEKTRTLNKAVAHHLPRSNDQVTLCLREFTRIVLNMKQEGDPLPNPPNDDEAQKITQVTPAEILTKNDFFQISCTNEENYGRRKSIPGKYKEKCQKELEYYGLSSFTFQWDIKGITIWDSITSNIIVKHWLHAKSEGAFSRYAIDTQHGTFEIILGLLERWLRGQKDIFRRNKSKKNPTKSRLKNKVC